VWPERTYPTWAFVFFVSQRSTHLEQHLSWSQCTCHLCSSQIYVCMSLTNTNYVNRGIACMLVVCHDHILCAQINKAGRLTQRHSLWYAGSGNSNITCHAHTLSVRMPPMHSGSTNSNALCGPLDKTRAMCAVHINAVGVPLHHHGCPSMSMSYSCWHGMRAFIIIGHAKTP
jgi:hypothetical protein